MSKNTKNNFILQGSILAIASILVRIIGLLYRSPLTDIIGDEGMGYYSAAYAMYSIILLISSYSIPLAVSKLVSTKIAKKEYNNAQRMFYGSLLYAIVVGGIAAFCTYKFADYIIPNMPQSVLALKVLSPTIFLSALLGVLRGYFQGHNNMVPTSISQILEQVFNAIVSILGAYVLTRPYLDDSGKVAEYGAAGSALGTGAGVLGGLLLCLGVYGLNRKRLKKRLAKDKTIYEDSYGEILKILAVTITPVILSTAIYNASASIDVTLFSNIMSARKFDSVYTAELWGIYSNKYTTLVNVPTAIASAIASAIIPSITTARAMNRNKEARAKVDIAIKFTMMIAIPCAVGMMVLASPIMQLIFPGNTSELAPRLLMFGSISIILVSLSTITNAVLQGINKMSVPVIHSAIALILHIVVVVTLLYMTDLHVYSVLIASILFSLIMCILNAMSLKKYLDYKQGLKSTILVPAICSIIMGIIALGVYKAIYFVIHINMISLFMAIILAMIVYFVLMIKLKGITEEELRSVPKGHLLIKLAKKLYLL